MLPCETVVFLAKNLEDGVGDEVARRAFEDEHADASNMTRRGGPSQCDASIRPPAVHRVFARLTGSVWASARSRGRSTEKHILVCLIPLSAGG